MPDMSEYKTRIAACDIHPVVPNARHPCESFSWAYSLLLVIITGVVTTVLVSGGLGLLPPHTAGAATTEGRGQGKVDVLLGVEADHEGRDVDDLLANTIV
jgi:hypothetical protein